MLCKTLTTDFKTCQKMTKLIVGPSFLSLELMVCKTHQGSGVDPAPHSSQTNNMYSNIKKI